ncbi:MAG: NB-ARC domain-containing protein, partial [Cyanobacteria bacterium J06560_5]
MSEIKIFLASSSELQADREQFEIFIRRRNKAWRDQNITLDLELWEDFFDAMSAEGLQSEYNKVIKECDIFVMLVHNKVGKYTAEEFDHAFGQFSETGKPLIFTYFKPYITRDKSNIKSVWAFEEKLEELKHYKSNYESIAELREDFWKQLEKYAVANGLTPAQPDAKLEPSEGLMARYRVPLQMPPLPDHFVERPEPQNAVKAQLLCDNDKGGTLVVSAIYGLGGIGKSVLASKLTHDSAVQDYFDDGILWVTLGQNPDILPLLSGWIQALGDYDYKPTAIESASNHLRTLLYNKCILLVVDDVWNPAHLEPFRVGGDKSRVMVTTREARIPDAQLHSLDVMDEAQALALMTQKIKEPLSEVARRQALEFAGRVGYLPLALDLAASQIEDGVRWQELLEDFTDEVARLESLDIYGAGEISGEMPDDEKRRKYSLLACFNLSLKQLSGEQLQQFAWLGVVPEDVRLTQEMAETLWQVRGRQAGSILRTFRAKSLVLQGAKQQSGGLAQERPSYRMHDLMHDLAQQLLQQPVEPEGEDALPGLGLTVAAAHGELLARYKAKTVAGKWHTLKDDGYIFAHLTWHMEQAQQPEEIHGLLRASNEAGPNGWYEACDAIGNPAGFVNDMGRAWAIALESYEGAPGETVALLFRYALMRTSLNSLASNIPAKMVGGLVKEGYWRASQGLAYAQQAQDPWHRAACISAIAPYMPKVLLPDVLKTIGQIQDAAFRSYPLSKLAEFFPEIWPDTLNTIQKIQDRYGRHRYQTNGFSYRAQALIGIGQKLPTRYLFTAIDISHQIQDAMDKLLALIGLATRDEELWFEVLAMARDIGDDYYRVIALTAIAQADSELWPESLAITHKIENKYYQSQALHIMAQHLPELWPETLKIIREIKSEKERANALCSMAENLPSELWLEALAIIRQIEDEEARSSALCAIAQHLPELWPEALTIIREIEFGHSRSSALCSMVKHLPSELWSEALTIIHEIEDEDDQSVSLCLMGKNLPLELWPEVLTIIREIEDEEKQAIILSTITKHLPLELWSEALTITREIKDEEEQLNVLCAIAEYLPELWPEALTITRKIKDEEAQLNTLCAIAEYLPELWPEALTITRASSSFISRVIV